MWLNAGQSFYWPPIRLPWILLECCLAKPTLKNLFPSSSIGDEFKMNNPTTLTVDQSIYNKPKSGKLFFQLFAEQNSDWSYLSCHCTSVTLPKVFSYFGESEHWLGMSMDTKHHFVFTHKWINAFSAILHIKYTPKLSNILRDDCKSGDVWPWPNYCNISAQHIQTLLNRVAICCDGAS